MDTTAAMRKTAADYAAVFDPSLHTVAECARIVRDITAIESALALVKAQAAAKVAQSGLWRTDGAKNAAEHLARATGSSIGAAASLIETGRKVDDTPGLREAAAAGQISPAQASLIADAGAAATAAGQPGAADELIAAAKRGVSLGELRTQCARVKATADANPRATRDRIRDERSYRRWDNQAGKGIVSISGPLADILLMESHFAAARDAAFQQAYRNGRTERNDALDYDALMATLRAGAMAGGALPADTPHPDDAPEPGPTGPTGPHSGGPATPTDGSQTGPAAGTLFGPYGDPLISPTPGRAKETSAGWTTASPAPTPTKPGRRVRGKWWNAKIIIRVDADALTRGRPDSGEVCEVAGAGPIPVDDVRDAIAGGGFVAIVLTQGTKVTGVAHLGRHPTALQQTALEWASPMCSAEGCNRRARQVDHRTTWAATRYTLLDELDPLCDDDHDLITHRHWALVDGTGKRPLVPPDDPRHPKNTAASKSA